MTSGPMFVPDQPLQQARDQALQEQAQRLAELEHRASGLKRLLLILLVVLAAAVVYGWTQWNNPFRPVASELEEHWVRGGMFDLILRIESFRQSHGRLPRDLAEAGVEVPDGAPLRYAPQDAERYTLTVASEEQTFTYTTGDDLTPFARAAGVQPENP